MANRLSDFSFQRVGESRIWLDRQLLERHFLDAVADPDGLFERVGCQIVKDQRKIKVARVNLEIGGVSIAVYVKRYNAFSWLYRLRSIFRVSRAVRSLSGAMILAQAGMSTGRPLAAVESRRWAMLTKSFFLSEEIVCGETTDGYWQERLKSVTGAQGFKRRRKFLANLGKLFRQLHDQRIYHNDLKDANILVRAAGEAEQFYLLDLEGVRSCCYLSRRRRVKNIVQLNRSLGRFLSKTEKLHWLNTYLAAFLNDDQETRRWIGWILPMTQRADRRSAVKHRVSARRGTLARRAF
jgi:hypothetical protein